MSRVERNSGREVAGTAGTSRRSGGAGRLGRLISLMGSILLTVSIIMCLGLVIPRFAGIGQYVVISGSMEPGIPVGSIVYSTAVDPSSLDTGDIIVFYSNEGGDTPVTHRVVENHTADSEIITKGDANAQNDLSPVVYPNIIGKVVLHLPAVGYAAAALTSLQGKLGMGCVIVAAYLLTVAGGRLQRPIKNHKDYSSQAKLHNK